MLILSNGHLVSTDELANEDVLSLMSTVTLASHREVGHWRPRSLRAGVVEGHAWHIEN